MVDLMIIRGLVQLVLSTVDASSAAQIYWQLRRAGKRVTLAEVQQALSALRAEGYVRRDNGRWRVVRMVGEA